jgi:hypothetical protein
MGASRSFPWLPMPVIGLLLICGGIAVYYFVIVDHESPPFCHKAVLVGLENRLLECTHISAISLGKKRIDTCRG